MFNVRGVLRHFTGRLKSSVNGHCGAQTSKECAELTEEEYKQLWTPNLWSSDARNRYNEACFQKFSRTAVSTRPKQDRDKEDSERKSERKSEWNTSSIYSRSWLEAIGLSAVLGISLNVLHTKQDQLIRRPCLPESNCYEFPRWFARFARFALSMPYSHTHDGIVKSVLPSDSHSVQLSEHSGRSSSASEQSEFSKDLLADCENRHPDLVYTSETAALLSTLRNQLADITNDYMNGLYKLLGFDKSPDADSRGQEEFTMGLFHELGIGVKRNFDEALNHYVEAALEGHPIAVQNLISLHRYTSILTPISAITSIHRSASTPVLSQQSSGFSDDGCLEDIDRPVDQHKSVRRNSRRFWADDDSGHGDASLSRSGSFPDLSSILALK